MNRAELKTLLSYWVDDLGKTYFTDAQMNVFLNMAQREVQRLLIQAGEDYYMVTKQCVTTPNQRNYVIPSDMLQTHRFEIKTDGTFPNENKRTIYPLTPQQQDLLPGKSGDPAGYYMQNNMFILIPCPGSTTYTMILHYSYLIEDMDDDSDIPDVPDAYHELIALLAARDCYIKDGRESQLLEKKIDSYIMSIKKDAENRNLDSARMIVETDSQYYGSLY